MIEMQTNIGDIIGLMDRIQGQITDQVRVLVKDAVEFVDARVHARTPVHTGAAIRNMVWTMDTPTEFSFHPIASPEDPGRTSSMSLGSEPRRPPNEAAARETLRSLSFNDPFHAYILTNNAEDIGLVEDGTSGLPGKSRAPNGVFAITYADLIVHMGL